jgi:DNA-binding XRE family transcriptional regulator
MTTSDFNITLGKFLKKSREDVELTQEYTASEMGISASILKQYETNRVCPNLFTAYKLCDLYDFNWEELGEVLEYHIFDHDGFRYGDSSGEPKQDPPPSPPPSRRGRPSAVARIENGRIGEEIVEKRLVAKGWSVINMNYSRANFPNLDLKSEKGGKIVRIEVKSKRHERKANLCGSWNPDTPTFNKVEGAEKADFLVMARFTDTENECFVLTIEEAEKLADWFGQHILTLGNQPHQFQPYVSLKPRQSRFKFNTRQVWEPYSERWDILDQ